MKELVAKKIRNARLLRGLSLQAVADHVHVSKQMISKHEKGVKMPTSQRLIALAKLFELKVDYFFQPFTIDISEVNFRKKASFGVKEQKALKEQIKIRLENYLWIENELAIDYSFQNSLADFSIASLEDVEQAVTQLRKTWYIGNDPLHNIIQLLEDKEIKVLEIKDVEAKFDGLATYANDKYPVIVVNKSFDVERKRFTLLHELGHLLLDVPTCTKKDEEHLCNRFASAMLLPRERILAEYGEKRTHVSIQEMIATQIKYGASIPAIAYRLKDLGIVSSSWYKSFCIKQNTFLSFKEEVNSTKYQTREYSNRYENLVRRALAEEIISVSKASSLLQLNIEELLASEQYI